MGVATRMRQPGLDGFGIACSVDLVAGSPATHAGGTAFPAFGTAPRDILFIDITVEAGGETQSA